MNDCSANGQVLESIKDTTSLSSVAKPCFCGYSQRFGHGDSGLPSSCSPREERFTRQTVQHPHIWTRTRMHDREHTPIIPITRLQQANSQQQLWKVKWVLCACLSLCVSSCVCAAVPLGSQGPCRALAVLIRQPQPRRVHHRENRKGRADEVRSVCRESSKKNQNCAHLLRRLVEGDKERRREQAEWW